MKQHHQHSHDKQAKREHTAGERRPRKGVHRDWRFWVAVLLMLAAMGAYVATMDEALVPGGQVDAEMPADAV
jgi:hypothetical protein